MRVEILWSWAVELEWDKHEHEHVSECFNVDYGFCGEMRDEMRDFFIEYADKCENLVYSSLLYFCWCWWWWKWNWNKAEILSLWRNKFPFSCFFFNIIWFVYESKKRDYQRLCCWLTITISLFFIQNDWWDFLYSSLFVFLLLFFLLYFCCIWSEHHKNKMGQKWKKRTVSGEERE